MLLYNVLARSRHKLPVRSVAFLLRPDALKNVAGRVRETEVDGTALDFSYRLVKVWELAVGPLLNGPLGTLALAPLASTPTLALPKILNSIRSRLDREPVQSKSKEIWAASRLLLPLRYKATFLDSLMLNLLDLQESSVYQEIINKGRVEGRVQGERDVLRRLATERFGKPAGTHLRKLKAMTAQSEIDRLIGKLFSAAGWDDLFAKRDPSRAVAILTPRLPVR